MYNFLVDLDLLTASLLLCSLFIVFATINIKRSKKVVMKLIFIITLLIMKIIYIMLRTSQYNMASKKFQLFYMFIVSDIIFLILFYCLSKFKNKDFKNNIVKIDYVACIFSFYLSSASILGTVNTFLIIGIFIFNIFYFFKHYQKVILSVLLFYIINFMIMFQIHFWDILIFSNSVVDLLLSYFIFYKVYMTHIKNTHVKYLKIEGELSRTYINKRFYEEKLNNKKIENDLLIDHLNSKKRNVRSLLQEFKKSALLINGDGLIINTGDIVFKTMFSQYKDDNYIRIEDFLDENIVENERFLKNLSYVEKYDEDVSFELNGKDGRIFECILSIYEKIESGKIYKSSAIVCIFSDITYEKKLSLKKEANDTKYMKIAENIPYSIILEKNKEIIYNNNKLDLNNGDIKNIILNDGIKGEINYTDDKNKEISLYINKMKFNENGEEVTLIETRNISKYKNLLRLLDESANQYKTLVDTIPEAICVLNYENKEFEYANDTFFKIFKIKDIENMDFDEIYNDISISTGNLSENIKYIRKTLKDGCGSLINIEISAVYIDVDKESKMVLIIRDITEEIKVEHMKQEIEEGENIIKDMDDFFINMSHELLTPANLLHTSNQFIERTCKDVISRDPGGEFANCVSIMKKHIDILITLTNKVMELSKLEGNYHKNSEGICDIVSLCEDIVTELNKYTVNKNINIVFDTQEEEIYVNTNQDDITKAILTIISAIVKNSKIKSTINFNIKVKNHKVIISIENINRYNYQQYLEKYEEKIINLSMSIAKLIVNMYKGKISLKTNKKDSVIIEIELDIVEDIVEFEKINKSLDENFIYNEYKNICTL